MVSWNIDQFLGIPHQAQEQSYRKRRKVVSDGFHTILLQTQSQTPQVRLKGTDRRGISKDFYLGYPPIVLITHFGVLKMRITMHLEPDRNFFRKGRDSG